MHRLRHGLSTPTEAHLLAPHDEPLIADAQGVPVDELGALHADTVDRDAIAAAHVLDADPLPDHDASVLSRHQGVLDEDLTVLAPPQQRRAARQLVAPPLVVEPVSPNDRHFLPG